MPQRHVLYLEACPIRTPRPQTVASSLLFMHRGVTLGYLDSGWTVRQIDGPMLQDTVLCNG